MAAKGAMTAEGTWSLKGPGIALTRGGAAGAAGADLTRSGLGVGTRLSADLLLPTDLGPVRAYLSVRGRNGSVTDRAAR